MRKVVGGGIATATNQSGLEHHESFDVYEDEIERWVEITYGGVTDKLTITEAQNFTEGHQQAANALFRRMLE